MRRAGARRAAGLRDRCALQHSAPPTKPAVPRPRPDPRPPSPRLSGPAPSPAFPQPLAALGAFAFSQ